MPKTNRYTVLLEVEIEADHRYAASSKVTKAVMEAGIERVMTISVEEVYEDEDGDYDD